MSQSGRSTNGRFGPGNSFAKGNPHARRVNRLRSLLMDSVSDDDLREVIQKLVTLAKSGDLPAIKELLDRTVGKPPVPLMDDAGDERGEWVLLPPAEERRRRLDAIAEQLRRADSSEADALPMEKDAT